MTMIYATRSNELACNEHAMHAPPAEWKGISDE